MRRMLILTLAIVLSLAACVPSRVTPITVPVLPTPDASGMIQCDQDTACFWRAYQGCATGTTARVGALFGQSTDSGGNTIWHWRTLSSGQPGAPCTIGVFEQVTVVLLDGNSGGAPGASYQCAQITRDPTGTLHRTNCQWGGSTYVDIDVAVHG